MPVIQPNQFAPIMFLPGEAWVLFDPINVRYLVLEVLSRRTALKNAVNIVKELTKGVEGDYYFALIRVPVGLGGDHRVVNWQFPYINAIIHGPSGEYIWIKGIDIEVKETKVPIGLRLDKFLKTILPSPSEFYEKYYQMLKEEFLRKVK